MNELIIGNTANSSGSFAFEITIDDVLLAINSRSPKQITEEDAASIYAQLNMGAIEEAAMYGDDLDDQTQYAHHEIYKQWCRANDQHIIEVSFKSSLGACAVTDEQFDAIKGAFDVFTSPATETDIILDCTAFDSNDDSDEEPYKKLAGIIGNVAAYDCAGCYVVFYVE